MPYIIPGIIVMLPEKIKLLINLLQSISIVEVARVFMNFTQNESCGKCVPCREGTKNMLKILERIVKGKGEMKDIETLE